MSDPPNRGSKNEETGNAPRRPGPAFAANRDSNQQTRERRPPPPLTISLAAIGSGGEHLGAGGDGGGGRAGGGGGGSVGDGGKSGQRESRERTGGTKNRVPRSPTPTSPSNAPSFLPTAGPTGLSSPSHHPKHLKKAATVSIWSQYRHGHVQNVMAGPARLNLMNHRLYPNDPEPPSSPLHPIPTTGKPRPSLPSPRLWTEHSPVEAGTGGGRAEQELRLTSPRSDAATREVVWQKEEGGRDKGEEAVEGEGEGGVVEGQGEEDLGPSKLPDFAPRGSTIIQETYEERGRKVQGRKGGREGGREDAARNVLRERPRGGTSEEGGRD
ncbi:hypothetical protein NSK_008103 [Nannochloropsis salina CCMP1776]|uniref:Uncharacterized protein n=1 Tax=Nannochloropsis salina CCMP1776 TaxID=1027361 RepID=A0A4D9CN40_9STRA|nr:hypothetical protein NSK_008103 [Nannochloropsis salina CCMP1776]|eukprot:TFJ80561.1 hypothetical protein NSK_008103 [Nannochloropsis salina CCMP1776]